MTDKDFNALAENADTATISVSAGSKSIKVTLAELVRLIVECKGGPTILTVEDVA